MNFQTCSKAEELSAPFANSKRADDLTASGTSSRKFGAILVAIDFSLASRRALDMAIRLAERQEAQLVLAHVVQSAVYATHLSHTPVDLVSMAAPNRQRLQTWAVEAIPASLLTRTALFSRSLLFREIRDAAHQLNADLVSCQSDARVHVTAFPSAVLSD